MPRLIQRSEIHRGVGLLGYALGVFLLAIIGGSYLANAFPDWTGLISGLMALFILLFTIFLSILLARKARSQRGEQGRLTNIEELMQLRHWPTAAMLLQESLSRPARTPAGRIQGLIDLSIILGRYGRFADAMEVQNYVLDTVQLDPETEYFVKLSRAMAMLREDHLVDANQAIVELRRLGDKDSGPLSLVELYRDVKTGHPQEAIELFSARLPIIRRQLGYRIADAYALAARAMQMLNRNEEATKYWADATTLVPREELLRRYPEISDLDRMTIQNRNAE